MQQHACCNVCVGSCLVLWLLCLYMIYNVRGPQELLKTTAAYVSQTIHHRSVAQASSQTTHIQQYWPSIRSLKKNINTIFVIWDSTVWWPEHGMDDRGIEVLFHASAKIYLFSTAFSPALKPIQPTTEQACVTFLEHKGAGAWCRQTPTSNTTSDNAWNHLSTAPLVCKV